MSDSADDIVRRMQDVRREAGEDVKGIVESAKTLSDWRHHVKHHPWVCVGAVAALGFVVAPKRKKAPSEDAKELAALLKQYNAGGAPASAARKGLAATLIGMATPFVMRTVMQTAKQHFANSGGPLASLFGAGPFGKAGDWRQDEQSGGEASFQSFNIPR